VDSSQDGTDIQVPDGRVSKPHARIERTQAGWRLHDERSKNGTVVGGQHVEQHLLRPGDLIVTGRSFWRYVEHVPRQPLASGHTSIEIGPTRTICPALIDSLVLLRLAATNKNPLLLLGETGSGKEFLAKQIHEWSGRKGEFFAINCAAINPELLGAELFGYVKGAFTGAVTDRAGPIETVAGGTFLLDEIGELTFELQGKLLRVLGEGEFSRVGEPSRVRRSDVRFIGATTKDLEAFRKDLVGRFERHFPGILPLC